jgi:hypothetical protein
MSRTEPLAGRSRKHEAVEEPSSDLERRRCALGLGEEKALEDGMRDRWRALCGAAVVAGFVSLPQAVAQEGRAWVDPPGNLRELPLPSSEETRPPEVAAPEAQATLASPPLPPQRPEDAGPWVGSAPAAEPEPGTGSVRRDVPETRSGLAEASPEKAVRKFAIDYLDFWSSEEVPIRDAVTAFYAPRVEFHGRRMRSSGLIREKVRFAHRWPEREYRARPETMQVSCEPAGDPCTVQLLFDFSAENKARRRRSAGTGLLELVVTLANGRPLITSENSLVQTRRREARGRSIGWD